MRSATETRPELLAPARDLETLKSALHFGADAVYVGGPLLQLRAASSSFSFEALEEAARLTHDKGKKLYVTVNCFAKNDEIPLVADYGKRLLSLGADAAIVSDPGVIMELRQNVPELPVHVSTQANTLNYAAVNFWAKTGCARVVLGREMTLPEIEALSSKLVPDVELEVFVHGAMCMAYSGRCLLSSFLNNRSGNRGECSQPCRWNYTLMEEKRANVHIPVVEEAGATAILSSHDLKAIGLLDRLTAAGVSSFKIEGRMKSPYYVGTVVNAYRQYLDGKADLAAAERELDAVSHRPFSTGFYLGECKTDPNNDGLYRQDCRFIAVVVGGRDGEYEVEMRNAFCVGDTLEVVSPESLGQSFRVSAIVSPDGEAKEKADLVQEHVGIPCPIRLTPGDILRKRL